MSDQKLIQKAAKVLGLKDFLGDIIIKYGALFVLDQLIAALRSSKDENYREMAKDLEVVLNKWKNKL